MTLTGQKILSIVHTVEFLKQAWEQHGGGAEMPALDANLDAAEAALEAAKATLEQALAAGGAA